MDISVLTFGQIADITGGGSLTISNINDTDELMRQLNVLFPPMQSLRYSIAVNQKIIRENTTLKKADTVALLPPFSGG
ncbi:MAG TPA: MoaD/ThiS family protein [Agriterribacter sp.]|nr:MoaD/ThiS family protein [Chitinophagaceae bacterium]HRP31369.1 MoaD/ThiS family protein [Agriterribacter sp.]